jgi:hypothetical protein
MHDSLFLMSRPSFIEGASRVLDLGDTMTGYNHSANGDEADHAAAWADWELISRDMRDAAARFAKDLQGDQKKESRQ